MMGWLTFTGVLLALLRIELAVHQLRMLRAEVAALAARRP